MFVEDVIIATELELNGLHHCFRGSSLATELPVKWPLIVPCVTSPATLLMATPSSYTPSSQQTQDFEAAEKGGPAMIYYPLANQKEWNDILAATKTGLALTGTAAMGKVGPSVGLLDIGESEDSYFFRVSLPGVAREEKGFSCDVDPDGKITIKGVTTTGEKTVCRNSQVFQMQTRNLCPPGHFSVSFLLPGAVNQNKFSGVFEADGILEGVVKKR